MSSPAEADCFVCRKHRERGRAPEIAALVRDLRAGVQAGIT